MLSPLDMIPRNPLFSLYFHMVLDDDPTLHDHPWFSVSWLIYNGYQEETECGLLQHKQGDFIFWSPWYKYRFVYLDDDAVGYICNGVDGVTDLKGNLVDAQAFNKLYSKFISMEEPSERVVSVTYSGKVLSESAVREFFLFQLRKDTENHLKEMLLSLEGDTNDRGKLN